MSGQNGPEMGSRVEGDDRRIPDRGTRTGVTDTYDSDLGQDAKNTVRSMVRDRPGEPEEA